MTSSLIYQDINQNTFQEQGLTIVTVKISISKVETAVLKNWLIFGENSSHKASVCLRVGGLKIYLDKDRLNSAFLVLGLPLSQTIIYGQMIISKTERNKYDFIRIRSSSNNSLSSRFYQEAPAPQLQTIQWPERFLTNWPFLTWRYVSIVSKYRVFF